MSSPQSTPLRKGKRKSAPLDVEVASATKKSRTSLQSAAISDSAVNGNAVSGRKRKSVSKAGAIDDEESENTSGTGCGKKRLSSSSEAIDSIHHESSPSSSVFQNVTVSASKTRSSISRSSSVSELAPAASTPRKAVRRASTSTPIQDAPPSRGRGRASRLQPITEAVPNVPLPVIPLDIAVGSSGILSAPPAHIAPPAIAPAPAPVTLATDPLAPARIILKDTWYSWLSALIIIALVTSSMLSNLGILPSPVQILPMTTFSVSSMHVNNSLMAHTHVMDHVEAGQTIVEVEILNQSINTTVLEMSTLVAEEIARRSKQDLKETVLVIEDVVITQDDEQSIIEEALHEVEDINFTQLAEVLEVEETLSKTATELLEVGNDEILPVDMSQEQVQAAVEAVSEATNETNQDTQIALEDSCEVEEEVAKFLPEQPDTVAVEEQALPEGSDVNIDTLAAEMDQIAASLDQKEQAEVTTVSEEEQEVSFEEVQQDVVAEIVSSSLYSATVSDNHGWHRIATSSSAHLHNHSEHTLTSSHNMHDDFTWKNDLALGARGTKIDVSGLAVTAAPSNKKENAVTKFLMQPLKMLNKQGSSKKLNSNKPIKDMFTSCVYFNHQAGNTNSIVIRLLKIANVSSIAITHLLPNTSIELAQCSGVKDFTVHNMHQASTVNILAYSNQVGEFVFSYDDINSAQVMTSKTDVAGGTVIKQIFHLPTITSMKAIGFGLSSLQNETASVGCLCRMHVYGEFTKDEKEQERGEEEEQQQRLM